MRNDLSWSLSFDDGSPKRQIKDPIKYFADPQNRAKGIIKQQGKPNVQLIVTPFPELQRGADQFFFNNVLQPS